MATQTEEEDLNLSKGDNPTPRIRMSEMGVIGLSKFDGRVLEQDRKELRFPQWNKTVKNMLNYPTVYSGVELIKMMIMRGEIDIEPPLGASEEEIKRTQFIKQCMNDMEHPFEDVMVNALSYIEYGYAIIEKVWRQRLYTAGSNYNDGLIGWRKLPPRSQDTIGEWKWSDDGRKLTHAVQDLGLIYDDSRVNLFAKTGSAIDGKIELPVEKILHFRYNPTRDNPCGSSPLASAWLPWKYITNLEEVEAVGIQRNMNGVLKYYLPPKYMAEDAEPQDKAIYDNVKRQLRNYQNNEQAGFAIPNIYDEHSKQRLFDLVPIEVNGTAGADVNAIIQRYDNKILMTLFSDILKLGQDATGSFALAGQKNATVEMNIQTRCKEICSVFVNQLFKETYQRNGWDARRLPTMTIRFDTDYDLDILSKFIQRVGAVNMLPRTPKIVSQIIKELGFSGWEDIAKMTQEDLDDLFTDNETGAGEGMESGMSNGTGDSNKSGSENNSENAA